MKLKSYLKNICGLLIVCSTVGYGAASSPGLSIDKADNDLIVRKGEKILFTIEMAKKDEAFVAGSCVVVRRNVRETELFPDVDRLDVFQSTGRQRSYSEKDFGIRRLGGIRVFTSPDQTWAVVPDEEEGRVTGFFLISSNCSIQEIAFPQDAPITWKTIGGHFSDATVLELPSMEFQDRSGKENKIAIWIYPDGRYRIRRAQLGGL